MTRALFSAAVCRRSARDGFRLSRGPRCGGASAVPARAGPAAAGSASAAPPGGHERGPTGRRTRRRRGRGRGGERRSAQTWHRTEATPRDARSAARGGGGFSPRGGACAFRPPRATGCAPGQDARAPSAVEEARPPSASSARSTPGRGARAARVSRAPASPSTGVGLRCAGVRAPGRHLHLQPLLAASSRRVVETQAEPRADGAVPRGIRLAFRELVAQQLVQVSRGGELAPCDRVGRHTCLRCKRHADGEIRRGRGAKRAASRGGRGGGGGVDRRLLRHTNLNDQGVGCGLGGVGLTLLLVHRWA